MTPRAHNSVIDREAVLVQRVDGRAVPIAFVIIRDICRQVGVYTIKHSVVMVEFESGETYPAYWFELRLLDPPRPPRQAGRVSPGFPVAAGNRSAPATRARAA